jgi:23S rRNA pseudouridine1911/1915/1917 synthase
MTIRTAGSRVDRTVADWRGVSRAAVLRLLDLGALSCNGRILGRANKGDTLAVGDELVLAGPHAGGERPLPDASLDLAILQQGEGWLVVDKPAGVPVRPHALDERGTVLNAIAHRFPEVVGVGERGLRSGIVHRLDTDTSGTLLIATEQRVWERLRDAFAAHRVKKRYLAIVQGKPDDRGELHRDLRVARHQPAYVEVAPVGNGGDAARRCSLSYRVLERFADRAALIEIDLHTGFLHQIRAMMSDLGHPVAGDTSYGKDHAPINAPRQMLHATLLRFESIDAHAPLPDDMRQCLERLK